MQKTRLIAIYVTIIVLIFFSIRCENNSNSEPSDNYELNYYRYKDKLNKLDLEEKAKIQQITQNNIDDKRDQNIKNDKKEIITTIEEIPVNKNNDVVKSTQNYNINPQISKELKTSNKENVNFLTKESGSKKTEEGKDFKAHDLYSFKQEIFNLIYKNLKNNENKDITYKKELTNMKDEICEKQKIYLNELFSKFQNKNDIEPKKENSEIQQISFNNFLKTTFNLENIKFFIYNAESLDFMHIKNEISYKLIVCKIKYKFGNFKSPKEINFILEYQNYIDHSVIRCFLDQKKEYEIFSAIVVPCLKSLCIVQNNFKIKLKNKNNIFTYEDKNLIIQTLLKTLGFIEYKNNINHACLCYKSNYETNVNIFNLIYAIFRCFDKKLYKKPNDLETFHDQNNIKNFNDSICTNTNGAKKDLIDNSNQSIQNNLTSQNTEIQSNGNINNEKLDSENIVKNNPDIDATKQTLLLELLKNIFANQNTENQKNIESKKNTKPNIIGKNLLKKNIKNKELKDDLKKELNNIISQKKIDDNKIKKDIENQVEEEQKELADDINEIDEYFEFLDKLKLQSDKIEKKLNTKDELSKSYSEVIDKIFKRERIITIAKKKISEIEKLTSLVDNEIDFLQKWEKKIPEIERELKNLYQDALTINEDLVKKIKEICQLIEKELETCKDRYTGLKNLYDTIKLTVRDDEKNKLVLEKTISHMTDITQKSNELKSKKSNLEKKSKKLKKEIEEMKQKLKILEESTNENIEKEKKDSDKNDEDKNNVEQVEVPDVNIDGDQEKKQKKSKKKKKDAKSEEDQNDEKNPNEEEEKPKSKKRFFFRKKLKKE